jgi:Tfp pilus assembly protein FimT
MKKKMLIITVLAALIAVPVFAATTDQVNLQNQCDPINGNHQQMIQQAVNDGTITSNEAATLNESMQKVAPIMQKIMRNGGMMGNGNGMMRHNGMMQNSGMMQNCNNNGQQ